MATKKNSGAASAAANSASKKEKEKIDEAPIVAGIAAPHKVRPDAPASSVQLLPPTGAPSSFMVKVKEKATGRIFAAWPVDARELVTHPNQEHEYATEEDELPARGDGSGAPMPAVPPTSTNPPIGVDPQPPENVPIARRLEPQAAKAQLDDMGKKDLQALAVRAGVNPKQSDAKLREALHTHAVAGTVSLNAPASLASPPANAFGKAGG